MKEFKFSKEERRELRDLFESDQGSIAQSKIDFIEQLISARQSETGEGEIMTKDLHAVVDDWVHNPTVTYQGLIDVVEKSIHDQSDRLKRLADWFDNYDMQTKGHANENEVQQTLRAIADRLISDQSETALLRAELEQANTARQNIRTAMAGELDRVQAEVDRLKEIEFMYNGLNK